VHFIVHHLNQLKVLKFSQNNGNKYLDLKLLKEFILSFSNLEELTLTVFTHRACINDLEALGPALSQLQKLRKFVLEDTSCITQEFVKKVLAGCVQLRDLQMRGVCAVDESLLEALVATGIIWDNLCFMHTEEDLSILDIAKYNQQGELKVRILR
jgi:hypothetical protein